MTAFRTICSCLVVVLLCERVVCEEFFHFLPREARRVIEGNVHIVSVSWSANTLLVNDEPEYTLSIDSNDESVASVVPHTRRAQSVRDPFGRVSNYSIDFSVRGIKLGVTSLRWMISSPQANYTGNYYVSVIREPSQAQIIFTILVTIIISINNINMGCLLDLDMIRKVLKAPVAPVIGFCCQFLFMPLVSGDLDLLTAQRAANSNSRTNLFASRRLKGSYGIGLLFFPDKISWRLGLFTLGCSPGGTGSNFWTLLFHGDVDLSVTMTFVSTIAALGMYILRGTAYFYRVCEGLFWLMAYARLAHPHPLPGMMPLWMFTLGKSLLSEGNVSVPYVNLFFSLLALTIPLVIGLALQKYKPTWANFLRSILRPFTVCVMIITIVGGSYLSYYIFTLMDWKVVAAGLAVALGITDARALLSKVT